MKIKIVFAILISVLFSNIGESRGGGFIVGNGGDHIRATFLKVGAEVISFLKETEQGQSLISKNQLSINSLEQTLDIQKISVVENGLKDNLEVPVDATGSTNEIILNKSSWMEHFEKERDIYYLVFHEMLRGIGFNDDNYVISKVINPFPIQRRIITRVESIYPLIEADSFKKIFSIQQLKFAGTGCPTNAVGTLAEFDFERNILDFKFSKYNIVRNELVTQLSDSFIGRKDCTVVLPFVLPQGKKLTVTQIDFSTKFEVNRGDKVSLTNEVFFAGLTKPRITKASPQFLENTQGRLLLRRDEVLKSECGQSGLLRVNTSAILDFKKILFNNKPEAGVKTNDDSIVDVDRVSLYFKLDDC